MIRCYRKTLSWASIVFLQALTFPPTTPETQVHTNEVYFQQPSFVEKGKEKKREEKRKKIESDDF